MTADYALGILSAAGVLVSCLYTCSIRLPAMFSSKLSGIGKRRLFKLHINVTFAALPLAAVHTFINYNGFRLSPNYIALGSLAGLTITGLILRYRKLKKSTKENLLVTHILLTLILLLSLILHLIITLTMGYH